jgi:hypothetical protein
MKKKQKPKPAGKRGENAGKRGRGRPPLGEKLRAVELRVRMTPADLAGLSGRAAAAGQTVSDFVRAACGVGVR